MEPANNPSSRLWEISFLMLWLFACAGIVAVCAWLVVEENRRISDLQAVGDYLQKDPNLRTSEVRSGFLVDLAELQERAALPLAKDLPKALSAQERSFEVLAKEYGELAKGVVDVVKEEPPLKPAVSYAEFYRAPHFVFFTSARTRNNEPRYSFRLDFGGAIFPSENFQDLRRGDWVGGWKVLGATARKMRGIVIERTEMDEISGRAKTRREKMPNFEIYSLSLEGKNGLKVDLTIPKSEQDGVFAGLSKFELQNSVSGETSVARISKRDTSGEEAIFEVKAGSEFVALGNTYRVLSVQPSALRLKDVSKGSEVVWERGLDYD